MRNLFLALVLANLAFAAWRAWYAPVPAAPRSSSDGLPRLTLVTEVPADLRTAAVVVEPVAEARVRGDDAAAAERPEEPPANENEVVAAVELSPGSGDVEVADAEVSFPATSQDAACTSIGPFRELAQAAAAAATLREAGLEPEQRVAEGEIWIGYWVYIQAIPTEAEANEILARVRAEGIEDSYVIPNSDSGNLVSLGVFSEISGVSRRRDQVRALGFEPQVVDRTRRAQVYWINVLLGVDETLDFDALQPPGRIMRLEQRPCDA